MTIDRIIEATIRLYKDCNIKTFPIDCFEISNTYGYDLVKYGELKAHKLEACKELSEDACILENTIYYDESQVPGRIRFSIMHELGHVLSGAATESDADTFASHSLAPRMAIHYSGCKNANDVSRIFDISFTAAEIAFDDYRRWHRYVVYHKMSQVDKAMYDHFYNERAKKFVWHIEQCWDCAREIYNQPGKEVCSVCQARSGAFYDTSPDPLSPESRAMGYIFGI